MSERKVQDGESIDAWILRAPTDLQPVLHGLRERVLASAPGMVESVKWRHPYYSLNGEGLFSLMWFTAHVNLEVWHGAHLGDHDLLQGSGKHARHVKVHVNAQPPWSAIEPILAAACERAAASGEA